MFWSKLLTLLGLLCLLVGSTLLWQRYNPQRLSFTSYRNHSTPPAAPNPPVRVKINDLKIDLPIIPSKIIKNQWETTGKGVSWLSTSPIPGTTGNSILYGHNWTSLLGNLVNAHTGQLITVYYQDGTQKSFEIEALAAVNPDDIHILDPSQDERITLYTCTGLMDSKRFVVVAKSTNRCLADKM